ncbi:hypothetical protein [Nocardia brasiliensis]|uniref:hypothetical protein n=1 Tax=Nocardia brasiliensis TaxID=37326 RepID=UPI001895C2D9|nr:hypothetical protein [Nocardia brasiliensis]MBF6547867.1 hypothetical protein [Nocardia brasiliensis]
MGNVENDSLAGEVTDQTAPKRWRRGMAASVAALAALGLAGAAAGSAAAAPATACLWAGTDYAQGTEVTAGGRIFTCAADRGAPVWVRGAVTGAPSTVANPGARTRPAGTFSRGAQQPGTEYNDYCVGSQLIDGSEAVYQVVADAAGALRWQAAGPITQWVFAPGTGPVPTTRSASLCPAEPVLWPPN